MKKIVIVINGSGGSGKDTVCGIVAREYRVSNVSAITPIKELAARGGWRGEKDDRARKLLADLKRLFAAYNDLPTRYLVEQYRAFAGGGDQVMFVHIREREEIEKFIGALEGVKVVTLLIQNPRISAHHNASDDQVEDMEYDYRYQNSGTLAELERDFPVFFRALLERERVRS